MLTLERTADFCGFSGLLSKVTEEMQYYCVESSKTNNILPQYGVGCGILLAEKSRFYIQHELRFRTYRDHGPPLPFRSDDQSLDVETVIRSAVDSGKAEWEIKPNDVVRLTAFEVRPQDNIAILLFRRSDPTAAPPVLENQKTRKLRQINKRADEAVAVSAHLFLELTPQPTAAHPTHRAIMEEVPSLGRSYIHHLLKVILRDARYSYTERNGEESETYTLFDMHGIKSQSVGGALEKHSAIQHITLVRPASPAGLDTDGEIIPRDEQMRLVIKSDASRALQVIRKIQAYAKGHKWNDIRVQIDMPEHRSRIVHFTREMDAADVLFVRSERIEVDNPLAACTDTINDELVEKAQELFGKAAAWPQEE